MWKTDLLIKIAAFLAALGVITQWGRNVLKSMFRFVVQPITAPLYRSMFGVHLDALKQSIDEIGVNIEERHTQDRAYYGEQMEGLTDQIEAVSEKVVRIDKEMHPNGGGSFRDDMVRVKALAEANNVRISEVSDDVRDAGHRIDRILELQRCTLPHEHPN